MLLVTLFCSVLALALTFIELSTTKKDLALLKERSDLIDISDPNLVYVRELPQPGPLVFQYKVAIPAESEMILRITTGNCSGEEEFELVDASLRSKISESGTIEQYNVSVCLQISKRAYKVAVTQPKRSSSRSKTTLDESKNRLAWLRPRLEKRGPRMPSKTKHFPVKQLDPSESLTLVFESQDSENLRADEETPDTPQYFKVELCPKM